MVSGPRVEAGTQNLSAGVRKTIQSIKEIVGNHSDADIYLTLKETNMDPNETAQKLLNQDPFHEVQRKKDKRKEVQKECHSVPTEPRKPTGHVDQGMKSNAYSDRNLRRGGYGQNNIPDAGVTREFRVVRDNKINRNVHVPSLASRRAANVRAIKHEVGAVGVWRHSSENSVKHSSMQGRSVPNSQSGRDGFSREPFRSFPAISKGDQPTQSSLSESTVRSISVGKSSLNNRFGSRPNHQPVVRHKAPHANKEWKPKSSVIGPGVTGTSSKSASSPANNPNSLATKAARLQDKLSHLGD